MLDAIKMYFISSIINIFVILYIFKKIYNFKFKPSMMNKFIALFLAVSLNIIICMFINENIRFFLNTTIVMLFALIIFNDSIDKIIIVTVLEQFTLLISELLFAIIVYIFFKNYNFYLIQTPGIFIANLSIFFISILIININFVKKFYNIILDFTLKIKKIDKLLLIIFFFISTNITLFILYSNFNNNTSIFINILFIIIYAYIFYVFLYEKGKNITYMEEKKILIESMNEYEKMLDYQRVNNHENKNQLLVIKSMIEKKDEKTVEYINEIIKEKREDNEVVYTKAKRIPSGGLQGLIYQKMLLMQENNIEVVLDVGTKVRKIDLTNISSKMNYDICRIVGIILDNAIEETIKFSKKEREIIISMYVDVYFFIEVSNRIKENIDINKISEKGYTTKTKGHGYGLSLLNKIVDENDNIYNEIRIVNNIFTQIVKIKM